MVGLVADSPHKIFIGGLPNYLQEEQVLFIAPSVAIRCNKPGVLDGNLVYEWQRFNSYYLRALLGPYYYGNVQYSQFTQFAFGHPF